jgi:hypothetical protein
MINLSTTAPTAPQKARTAPQIDKRLFYTVKTAPTGEAQ